MLYKCFINAHYVTASVRSSQSDSPPEQDSTDREPCPHRRQQHQIPLFQPPLGHRIAQRQRNRRGGGISIALDIDDDFFGGQPKPIGSRQNDAAVVPMGERKIPVLFPQPLPPPFTPPKFFTP